MTPRTYFSLSFIAYSAALIVFLLNPATSCSGSVCTTIKIFLALSAGVSGTLILFLLSGLSLTTSESSPTHNEDLDEFMRRRYLGVAATVKSLEQSRMQSRIRANETYICPLSLNPCWHTSSKCSWTRVLDSSTLHAEVEVRCVLLKDTVRLTLLDSSLIQSSPQVRGRR